jgi:hypothetical protein
MLHNSTIFEHIDSNTEYRVDNPGSYEYFTHANVIITSGFLIVEIIYGSQNIDYYGERLTIDVNQICSPILNVITPEQHPFLTLEELLHVVINIRSLYLERTLSANDLAELRLSLEYLEYSSVY